MLNTLRTRGSASVVANTYQQAHQDASPRVCACSQKPYGLGTVCVEHAASGVDAHRCPGRVASDGKHLACSGTLQLVRAARQDWLETPAVLACSVCPNRLGVLLTFRSRYTSPPLAAYEGPCPCCKVSKVLVDENRPLEGEFVVRGDIRFRQSAYHQVPACAEFLRLDLVDISLRALGVAPSLVLVRE